jgi:hypothetical protein
MPSSPRRPAARRPLVTPLEDRSVPAVVSGLVYADVNGNSVQDAGEAGLGGATVQLDAGADGTIDRFTITENGAFSFSDVADGPNTVIFIPLPNTTPVGTTIRPVTVTGADVGGLNLGLQPTGHLTGSAYADLNGNAKRDAGEPGVAGVAVSLDLGGDGTAEFTAVTAADGSYKFNNVADGTHRVTFLTPVNYLPTSNINQTVQVTNGVAATSPSLGLRPTTSISGRVTFTDTLPGRPGLAGVTVQLDQFADGSVDLSTTTDEDGAYYFANLPNGTHAISVVAPPGTQYSTGSNKLSVPVSTGTQAVANIGLVYPGQVSGSVYVDLNGNAKRDEGEAGLPPGRVQVDLYGKGTLVDVEAKAQADGSFTVAGLPNGTHFLSVTPPGGHQATTQTWLAFTITDGQAATVNAVGVRSSAGTVLAIGNATAPGSQTFTFTPAGGGALTAVAGKPVVPPGKTGSRVVMADFNGDGIEDLITATGPGERAAIRIYHGKTGQELVPGGINVFEGSYQGGLNLAAGDFNGDGKADIVVAADSGGGPRVQILNAAQFLPGADPVQGRALADFMGIEDVKFRGGARVAVGDLNGDGRADLVVAAGKGGGPRVAVFDGTSLHPGAVPQRLVGDFFAFEHSLRNGAVVAVGDVNGDGRADLVTGAGPGGAPRVAIFSGAGVVAGLGADAPRIADFFVAGETTSRQGTALTVKDLDQDGRADVVASNGGKAYVYTSHAISVWFANPNPGLASPAAASVISPFATTGVNLG